MRLFSSNYDPEGPSDELVLAPAYMHIIRRIDGLRLQEAKFKMQALTCKNDFKLQERLLTNLKEREAHKYERLFELKKMELKAKPAYRPTFPIGDKFKTQEALKLLPDLKDSDLDTFFSTFEKIATAYNFPRDKWVFLLIGKLHDKANESINTMDIVDMQNYTMLRDHVRVTYKLQPQHYRQMFRKTCIVDNDTYHLFAGNLKLQFDR